MAEEHSDVVISDENVTTFIVRTEKCADTGTIVGRLDREAKSNGETVKTLSSAPRGLSGASTHALGIPYADTNEYVQQM